MDFQAASKNEQKGKRVMKVRESRVVTANG